MKLDRGFHIMAFLLSVVVVSTVVVVSVCEGRGGGVCPQGLACTIGT